MTIDHSLRRSKHTIYVLLETIIYEYRHEYYILQRCQQGKTLNPLHGSRQLPSDFACVSSKVHAECSTLELGHAALKALNDFDVVGHTFEQVDIPARSKTIASWFNARGLKSLVKNIRAVQILHDLEKDIMYVKPFDNHNRNNWLGPMEDKTMILSVFDPLSLGEAIQSAFLLSTYHPERKDPK